MEIPPGGPTAVDHDLMATTFIPPGGHYQSTLELNILGPPGTLTGTTS